MSVLSENIKKYRTDKNLTQQQLADRLFVTRQAISSWELGKTEPDANTLVKLSRLLDVTVDQLMGVPDTGRTETVHHKNKIDNLLVAYIFLLVICIFFRWLQPAADRYCTAVWSDIFATTAQRNLADVLWENNWITMLYAFSAGLLEFTAGAIVVYGIKSKWPLPGDRYHKAGRIVRAGILVIVAVNIIDLCLPYINYQLYNQVWDKLPWMVMAVVRRIRTCSIYPRNRWKFALLGAVYELCRTDKNQK